MRHLNAAADTLDDMVDDLASNWFDGVCAVVEAGVPTLPDDPSILESVSPIRLKRDELTLGVGTATVTANAAAGSIQLVLVLTDDKNQPLPRRTLTQDIFAADGTVTMYGTLRIQDFSGSIMFNGGWIYDSVTGPSEHPDSDAGFYDVAEGMFGCSPVGESGGMPIPPFGTIVGGAGNLLVMALNYLRDLTRPYTPPTSCSGPLIRDNAGQSCDGVDIPCADDLSDHALCIDDLRGVSIAFKKCMKGRAGCGGSFHKRTIMQCDENTSCGPCAYVPFASAGCNLLGRTIWYCSSNPEPCECADTVFHEMAHTCGANDSGSGGTYDAYRIGDWFRDECCTDEPPNGRAPPRPAALSSAPAVEKSGAIGNIEDQP